MKKKFTFKSMLLLCALIVGNNAWADTYTMSIDSGTKNGTKDVHWTANNATLTHSNVSWSASFSGGSITNSNNYVQIGSRNAPFTTITLSTSDISGTITEVKVGCGAYNSNATVAVTIGGNAFGGNAQTVGAAPSTSGPCDQKTFTGSASGAIVITITNGNNGRAGYIDYVSVTYSTGGGGGGSSQTTSDLVITNSTDLTFDLYPSSTVQVISYTTSSTGAITIEPESPTSYFSYVHNADDKIITITPLAVTPSEQTVTISQAADDDYYAGEVSFTVYITNSASFIPATYTLANSIVSGKKYIIVGSNTIENETSYYAMGYDKGSNRDAVGITICGTTATVSTADVYEFTVSSLATDGFYSIYDARTPGYLYAAGSNKNYLKTETTLDADGNGDWEITFNANVASIVASNSTNRNVMQFNYNSGSPLFNCYASASQSPVYLYVKDDAQTFTLDIDQYSNKDNGWYLIASPVSVGIAANAMVEGTYDLYRFNPTAVGAEWENYKVHNFALLEVGRGYLYANGNADGIQLSFTGWPISNGEVTAAFTGWNLIGNPLSTAANVNKDYYRINDTHTGIMTDKGTGSVARMEGIFVYATKDDVVTFTSASKNGKKSNEINSVVLNLNQNDKVIDRAIARLNSDHKLSKLTLFDDDTKIYIPQNGADYAIAAMDDNTQAFSLNFHAKTTGKYTLSLGETSDFSYVHIFDRMTGEDVDMLLEDNYSFIGSPVDSEERFIVRLSYNASSTSSETFAYQSGNGIIVNGEGTLEVYDVTGRKVMTTAINGVETINGLNSGVYIFKVVGDILRTQKIVVR